MSSSCHATLQFFLLSFNRWLLQLFSCRVFCTAYHIKLSLWGTGLLPAFRRESSIPSHRDWSVCSAARFTKHLFSLPHVSYKSSKLVDVSTSIFMRPFGPVSNIIFPANTRIPRFSSISVSVPLPTILHLYMNYRFLKCMSIQISLIQKGLMDLSNSYLLLIRIGLLRHYVWSSRPKPLHLMWSVLHFLHVFIILWTGTLF